MLEGSAAHVKDLHSASTSRNAAASHALARLADGVVLRRVHRDPQRLSRRREEARDGVLHLLPAAATHVGVAALRLPHLLLRLTDSRRSPRRSSRPCRGRR